MAKVYEDYPDDLLAVPEGMKPVLARMSKIYKLGIATSRVRVEMEELFDMFKFRKYFEASVTFDECRITKPAPNPLLMVARKLGVNPSMCLYVGDNDVDRDAAASAGMKFIRYSYRKSSGSVSSFREIPKIVASLS